MARLYTTGFETRDTTIEGLTVGSWLDTTNVRTGSASFSCSSRNDTPITGGATGRDYYARAYLYRHSNPSSRALVFGIGDVNTTGAYIYLEADNSLTVFGGQVGSGVQIGTLLSPMIFQQWYRVELHVKVAASTNDDTVEVLVDGTTVLSTTTANIGTAAPTSFSFGGASVSIDDVALNDSTGANQTSWAGEGGVVLLVPTADSAKGTGWTNDAAGTTNFFNAVDNLPPVGIADTTASTGLHQIRNATANANSNYDATMTTYAAAGIAAVDTVNVIDPIVVTGAPVVTSAKAGTVGVVSNPAISNVSLAAGGTSGAFWSGVAAGTYPTGWKVSHGTVTYGSSVTVGTAPVMRITQVTSSTRIAIVCFMGMYVDYTAGLLPYVSPYPPLLAQ